MASSKNQEREAREARERLKRYNARQSVHDNQISRRKRDNTFTALAAFVVIALAAGAQIVFFTAGPGMPEAEPTASATPEAEGNIGDIPSPDYAEGRSWNGEITLNDTVLAITLDGVAAPQGASAVISQIQSGYFIDKTCHRLVVSESAGLIQCGSLDGTGSGDPDYSFGPVENAPVDDIYPAGTIALARAGNDGFSQGRQFFIVFQDAFLPSDEAGGYTIVGTVTSGLDGLQSAIVADGILPGGSSDSDGPPVVPTTITSATIQ
ncbi:MAG: peptidylprolyl isomerase [Microbacteriaceae bacterium]